MMACPPSPSAFRRTLPGSMGTSGTTSVSGSNQTTTLNAKKSLLPAVEINGLVAKKSVAANVIATASTTATASPGKTKSNIGQVPATSTPTSESLPEETRQRSVSSGSSQSEGQASNASSSSISRSNDSVSRQPAIRPGSRPSASGRSISTSSSASTDSGVDTPSTPAIRQALPPSTVSSKTATPGTGTPTAETPQQVGLGAIRGRAPGPGATGLAVSVQPYDGGNVGVLGGGVKLGGAGAIKTGPQGTSYKLKNATPGSAPPGVTTRRSQTPQEMGRSPAYEDASGGEGAGFPTGQQRGTATSPARPVKRRRGKPQTRPWQPKSHTSFVGAMGLHSGIQGMGNGGPIFPPGHVRGISVPSGMPNIGASPLPPPPMISQGVGIWGSPSPPLPHLGQGAPFGGMPFGAPQQQHQAGPSAIAPSRLNASSPGWNMAPPFVPSRTL